MESVKSLHEATNGLLEMLGVPILDPPTGATELEKLDNLIASYTARLLEIRPAYAELPPEIIPDAILVGLREERVRLTAAPEATDETGEPG